MVRFWRSRASRPAFAALAALAVAGTMAVPHPAWAGWHHGWGWGWGPRIGFGVSIPLVIPAPPPAYAYYGPPAYYYPPPRARVWLPAHYNWAGAYIPGHWVWR